MGDDCLGLDEAIGVDDECLDIGLFLLEILHAIGKARCVFGNAVVGRGPIEQCFSCVMLVLIDDGCVDGDGLFDVALLEGL